MSSPDAQLTVPRPIPRTDVLGVGISAIDMHTAVAEIGRWIASGERHYVCITGVHGVIESQRSPDLKEIHNRSGLTTPDGMPMVWASHWAGAKDVTRVYGPDLLLSVCGLAAREGWRMYFYGGGEGIPERLADRLVEQFPGLQVAGTFSPPFRPLQPEEATAIVDRINASRADIVWVGLSTPKQERWMAENRPRLEAAALIGVGAAFDIHAGTLPQAPKWMQQRGLEWMYRLIREPRRLWRRYLRNNPRFVWSVLLHPPKPWSVGDDDRAGERPA